ncbi:MAG: hypothetical protein ABSE06_12915 [Anaerolineaceae bacterium]|jgi:hypothetical protein
MNTERRDKTDKILGFLTKKNKEYNQAIVPRGPPSVNNLACLEMNAKMRIDFLSID